LGNLASAASSTIEATIGERFPLPDGPDHEARYDYGKVIGKNYYPINIFPVRLIATVSGIFLGAVWVYILVFQFLGPEMTQEERDEEAATVLEYESLRAQGISLADIGAGRVKIEKVDGEIHAQHIDDIEDMSGVDREPVRATEKV
jgi:SHS family lactate transporter-like MFS transporter